MFPDNNLVPCFRLNMANRLSLVLAMTTVLIASCSSGGSGGESAVGEAPVLEDPVVEAPVLEDPVVEAPVVEAPVLEDPVVEAPVVEAPVVEAPVVEEPVVEEQVVEAPVVEEPVVEEPVVEEPVVEAPVEEPPQPVVSAFSEIQTTVFSPICAECHGAVRMSAGLQLNSQSSFAAIVGVRSTQNSSLSRIEPGDPDNSYLVQKIEGTAAFGGRMPLGGARLPQDRIDLIRQWVTDGALPIGSSAVALAPRVVSASLDEDAKLSELPDSMTLVWSSPVDVESLNAGSVVSLLRSGGDGSFNDGNEVAIEVVVTDTDSPYVTKLTTSVSTSVEDSYLLRIAGEGDIYARAVDARSIDGDGDRQVGGNFNRYFFIGNF